MRRRYYGDSIWWPPFKYGMDKLDEADEYVEKTDGEINELIEQQAAADSELAAAMAAREEAIAKEARRREEQAAQLTLEEGMKYYEEQARGRLFGYNYTSTLDALGNEEIQLAQNEIDTITDAVRDEQRDNIPEVKFPWSIAGLFIAGAAGLYFYQRRKK